LKKASSTPPSKPHHHLDGVAEDGIDEHQRARPPEGEAKKKKS
jgi:hypothetical protein